MPWSRLRWVVIWFVTLTVTTALTDKVELAPSKSRGDIVNRMVAVAIIVCLAGEALAKLPSGAAPNVPRPGRQGGDTIETAFLIRTLPFTSTGTTTGYNDDYDQSCPNLAAAPDVVYALLSSQNQEVTIDLCGSWYDTYIWVYDQALALIGCNDDYYHGPPCGENVSRIAGLALAANQTYYIVIDGYDGSHGDYALAVAEAEPCVVTTPAGALVEGEPALHDGYEDQWNGGCAVVPAVFQSIPGAPDGEAVFSGIAGWYMSEGNETRDADWYSVIAGEAGWIQITADADYPTVVSELLPQDCLATIPAHSIAVACGEPATLTTSTYASGTPVWIWVGSSSMSPPPGAGNEYAYVLWLSGLEPGVPVASSTWSDVKALYR